MFLFYRAPLKIISRFCDWHFLTSSPDALEVCIRGCEARTNPTQQNAVQMQLGKGFSGAMYWKSLKHLKTLLNNTPISYAPYDPYVHSLSPPHVCCRYSPLVFSCTLFFVRLADCLCLGLFTRRVPATADCSVSCNS